MIPVLLKLAATASPEIQGFAVSVLGFVARPTDKEVVTFLEGCRNHDDERLRSEAADALKRLAMDQQK